jgi:alkanesulfonate monooxygenase SsuD/methylene tetrahydromethanopterin reductase-like flavin-dependent oxidoreductase (luciferase family)
VQCSGWGTRDRAQSRRYRRAGRPGCSSEGCIPVRCLRKRLLPAGLQPMAMTHRVPDRASLTTAMKARSRRAPSPPWRLRETLCVPQPLSRPPIMIGGGGEKQTLRLVAQYADACNLFGSPAEVKHKLGMLREHCERLGRNYSAIAKTSIAYFAKKTPGEFLAELGTVRRNRNRDDRRRRCRHRGAQGLRRARNVRRAASGETQILTGHHGRSSGPISLRS